MSIRSVLTKARDEAAHWQLRATDKVSEFMQKRHLTDGVWEPIFKWVYAAESRYNCMIDPELGRRVRQHNRIEFWSKVVYMESIYHPSLNRKVPASVRLIRQVMPKPVLKRVEAWHQKNYRAQQREIYKDNPELLKYYQEPN